ncbi:hypothetical protein P9D43_27880 [Neobacillus niacini]|uniref:hypothetical protein n=1 Tax=Neobacillus niacini TaxID=86668 RepID=UPI0007ABBD2D|nr:hypothetical protein [Neobacillus niacini]MEC1525824.1 hypothetical protein [Neobacillus niacini]
MGFKNFTPNITVTITGNGNLTNTEIDCVKQKAEKLENEYNIKAPEQAIANDPEVLEIINKLDGMKLVLECLGYSLNY